MDRKVLMENIPGNAVVDTAKEQVCDILGPLVMKGLGGMAGCNGTGMLVTLKVSCLLDGDAGGVEVQSAGKVELKVGGEEKTKPRMVDVTGQGNLFKDV